MNNSEKFIVQEFRINRAIVRVRKKENHDNSAAKKAAEKLLKKIYTKGEET